MNITYSDFEATVKDNVGEVLLTSGGRALFRVEMWTDGVRFTPVSTEAPRPVSRKDIQRYLNFFNETGSTNTSDYNDNFRNASYVLSVIQLCMAQKPDAPLFNDGTNDAGTIDTEFNAPEGDIKVRSHRQRERNRQLVLAAKALFQHTHGRLFCEVCNFDFMATYGDPDFIEAHHRIPLSQLEPGAITKLSDLAMVCANCHRMLHRGNPWPSIPKLMARMKSVIPE